MGIVLGGNCPGANCPGANCPGWEFSGGNCPGANCPGANCPVTMTCKCLKEIYIGKKFRCQRGSNPGLVMQLNP